MSRLPRFQFVFIVLAAAVGCSLYSVRADNKSASAPVSDHDKKFVTEAAAGGMTEVKLGQYASEHAGSDDVKRFGQMMVDDHTKANDELKQLASQKGVDLPSELPEKEQKMVDKLTKLSGADFDKQYMKAMLKDHEEDVAEFKKASEKCDDADLKSWASKTLPTLEQHLDRAKEIAKAMK